MKNWQLQLVRRELGAARIKNEPDAVLVTLINQFTIPEANLEEPHVVLAQMRSRINKEIAEKWEAISQILEAQSRAEYEEKRKVANAAKT